VKVEGKKAAADASWELDEAEINETKEKWAE